MSKKYTSRQERNRLIKHAAKERNRKEVARAKKAREDFIAKQATEHFKKLAGDDPNFAAMCEALGINPSKVVEPPPLDEFTLANVESMASKHRSISEMSESIMRPIVDQMLDNFKVEPLMQDGKIISYGLVPKGEGDV